MEKNKNTKTMNYLFRPWFSCVFPHGLYTAIKEMCNSSDFYDTPNCYLSDTAIEGSTIEDNTIFLTLDKRHPSYPKAIEYFKTFEHYIDHYQAGDITSNIVVVRINYPNSDAVKKLLASKYSKIYPKDAPFGTVSLNGISVKSEFQTRRGYERPYCVMMRDPDYFEEAILSLLDRPSDELIQEYWQREFDSPLDTSQEIINSNNL